jgi:hypothetical protein
MIQFENLKIWRFENWQINPGRELCVTYWGRNYSLKRGFLAWSGGRKRARHAGGVTRVVFLHFFCSPKRNEAKKKARPVFCFLKYYAKLAASPRKLRSFANAPPGSSLKFIHWMNFGRSALTRHSFALGKLCLISYESKKGPGFRLRRLRGFARHYPWAGALNFEL